MPMTCPCGTCIPGERSRREAEDCQGRISFSVPGPLNANNRVYWGKLPLTVQDDLVEIGALLRRRRACTAYRRCSCRALLSYLLSTWPGSGGMVIPFTDSLPAHRVAFAPLGPDLSLRQAMAWQVDIGDLLPIPRPETPLVYVLRFRAAYHDERENLLKQCSNSSWLLRVQPVTLTQSPCRKRSKVLSGKLKKLATGKVSFG